MPLSIDYAAVAPEIIVGAAVCLTLIVDLFLWRRTRVRYVSGVLALVAVLGALGALLANVGRGPVETLSGLFVLDGFAMVFKGIFLAVGAAVILFSIPPMRGHRYEGEYYFLVLASILGTILMPSSRELLMLFVSLELVSAPAFVIAGLRKNNPRSNEAALKFFLIGVLSAAVFVYGISLVYGFTGTTSLPGISAALSGGAAPASLLSVGLMFIVAAFGFKISAVPFHFWAPDTYEGSPAPLAAFLSVASKAAGFVGLLVILLVGFGPLAHTWRPVLAAVAVATMTLGNVMALKQRHLIRLLGYSSIGHAGYMLIPLAILLPPGGAAASAVNTEAVRSLTVYIAVYAVMNLGAFAVAIGLSKQYPTLLIRDVRGLVRRAPFHAFALAAFMISLGGIPPFAGWFAKFAIFTAAVGGGALGAVLAAFMVINSVISLYYYLGVVRTMYLDAPEEEGALRIHPLVAAVVGLCLVGVVVFGMYPEPFAELGRAATIVLGR